MAMQDNAAWPASTEGKQNSGEAPPMADGDVRQDAEAHANSDRRAREDDASEGRRPRPCEFNAV